MRRKNEIFLFEGEISREKYHSTNPIARRLVEDFMTSLLSLVEQSGSSRFLEIGCGEGQICGLLAKNGYEVKGIDISADAIAVAKREAKRHSLDIEFVQGKLRQELLGLVVMANDAHGLPQGIYRRNEALHDQLRQDIGHPDTQDQGAAGGPPFEYIL